MMAGTVRERSGEIMEGELFMVERRNFRDLKGFDRRPLMTVEFE